MPRYISQHTLACLTRQGAEELRAPASRGENCDRAARPGEFAGRKNVVEFEAPAAKCSKKWLALKNSILIGCSASNSSSRTTLSGRSPDAANFPVTRIK